MKFHTVYLMTILALTVATREEVEIDRAGRFLADRDVLMSELETHEGGLWTALDGIVYDITDFVHPGGEKDILKVLGMEADELYMEAYVEKKHPLTSAVVVSQPGIIRIGPLVYEPPTAPVSPVASPVASDDVVASDDAVASDAPVTLVASKTDAPEAKPTGAPSASPPASAATKEPAEEKTSKPTATETSSTASPIAAAAPTSDGFHRGALGTFAAMTTMAVVVVSMAYM